jgi:NAD(P)-dependent dehydrogenase (short-subunit alcohol dehydrogenase family)
MLGGVVDMEGRVCVVTGGTAGIGRATAEDLARRGATVVILGRASDRVEAARREIVAATGNEDVEVVVADLESQRQVRQAAAEIVARHPQVHVLVNNAGVFPRVRAETEDGIEKAFAVNYLSHFLLTHQLLDALKAGAPSRVVNVASQVQGAKIDFDDLMFEKRKYSTMRAVSASKLALIYFTMELAERFDGTGVTVNAIHPGLTKTAITKDMSKPMRTLLNLFSGPPARGARTSVYLATSDEVRGVSGKFFIKSKQRNVPRQATDQQTQKRLWEVSRALVNLGEPGPRAPRMPTRPKDPTPAKRTHGSGDQ